MGKPFPYQHKDPTLGMFRLKLGDCNGCRNTSWICISSIRPSNNREG